MDTLSKSDFPEIISGKFSSARVLTPDQVEATIIDTFEKGQSTEEIFLNGMNVLDRLEKGKRANVGEIRTWGGKKYQKGANGWTPVKEGAAATESKKSEFTPLTQHLMSKTEGELNQMAGSPNDPLSEHSRLELNRRNSEKGMEPRYKSSEIDKNKLGQEKDHFDINHKLGGDSKPETKVSGLEIYSKIGGGYGANGEVNGKKVKVDIPKEYFKGLASTSDKGFREKVKNLISEESKKSGSSEVSEKDRATIKERMESKLKERDQDYKNQKV